MNAIHRVGFIGLGAMGAPMAGHLYAKDMLAAVGKLVDRNRVVDQCDDQRQRHHRRVRR